MRILPSLTALAALGVVACSDGGAGPSQRVVLEVRVTTTGADLDENGYDLLLDGRVLQRLLVNDAVVIRDITAGAHTVALADIAGQCDAVGPASQTVDVTGSGIEVVLAVQCFATGVEIRNVTTGLDLDVDGYAVSVGGRAPVPMLTNGAVVVSRLEPGSNSIVLNGIEPNCLGSPDNPVEVVVSSRTVVPVLLALDCVAAFGSVQVSVTLTGADPDPNGVFLQIPSHGSRHLPRGAPPVVFERIPPGQHLVRMSDLTTNCTPAGGPEQSVQVTAGTTIRDTARVVFQVACERAEKIVFTRWPNIPPHWGYDPFVTVAFADGSNPVQIMGGYQAAWSPDGSKIAFVRVPNGCYYSCLATGLAVINGDGEAASLRMLTTDGGDSEPDWSPDGSKIVFARAGYLHVMNAAGGSPTPLVGIPILAAFEPVWSPDGTRIAFACELTVANRDICVVGTDGTGFQRLTVDAAWDSEPAWRPDGGAIAFTTTRFMNQASIAVMSTDGQNVVRLAQGWGPAWSRDGARLLFTQQASNGLVVVNADGSGTPKRITFEHDHSPSWRP